MGQAGRVETIRIGRSWKARTEQPSDSSGEEIVGEKKVGKCQREP